MNFTYALILSLYLRIDLKPAVKDALVNYWLNPLFVMFT